MSQQGIREYDAKKMWAEYSGTSYEGVLLTSQEDISSSLETLQCLEQKMLRGCSARQGANVSGQWVVKPDMLFGKRGKYGLVGVNLNAEEVKKWLEDLWMKEVEIAGVKGQLSTFLIEPFVLHTHEYYISIESCREFDRINFSSFGGAHVEEKWDSVRSVDVGVLEELSEEQVNHLLLTTTKSPVILAKAGIHIPKKSSQQPLLPDLSEGQKTITHSFINKLFSFFRTYGLTYLECNPFIIKRLNNSENSEHSKKFEYSDIVALDMVAKVDNCEAWKQKIHWADMAMVKPFGSVSHPLEQEIEQLDAETGASLKLTILNPYGRIGLVLGGGGASVIVMDKLAQMGLMDEVINYGELSGNPSYDHNKIYTQGLINIMCESEGKGERTKGKVKNLSSPVDTQNTKIHIRENGPQYLCLIGGIANFTQIDVLCQAFVDALEPKVTDLQKHNIHLLVRRGGINDMKGLMLIDIFAKKYGIPCVIADGDTGLTEVCNTLILD